MEAAGHAVERSVLLAAKKRHHHSRHRSATNRRWCWPILWMCYPSLNFKSKPRTVTFVASSSSARSKGAVSRFHHFSSEEGWPKKRASICIKFANSLLLQFDWFLSHVHELRLHFEDCPTGNLSSTLISEDDWSTAVTGSPILQGVQAVHYDNFWLFAVLRKGESPRSLSCSVLRTTNYDHLASGGAFKKA